MTPTDRAVLARPSAVILRAGAEARAAMALMSRASDGLLDLDHLALERIEPDAIHLQPAAEELVLDVEGAARVVLLPPGCEVGRLQHRPDDGAVAVAGEDLLLHGRVHEPD